MWDVCIYHWWRHAISHWKTKVDWNFTVTSSIRLHRRWYSHVFNLSFEVFSTNWIRRINMAKRIKLDEAASLSLPASFSDLHSSSDWTKCIICQDVRDERLQCPADSKRKDAGEGYKSFTENLMRFSDIDELPVKISLERLDDGDGIEATLRCWKASWHKSCRCKFNATKLERAEKRRSDNFKELDSIGGKYARSQKKAKVDIKVACLFCDQVIRDEESREAMTFKVNSRALESARHREDEALFAKLSAGVVMALEVKYLPKCLTGLYNRVRSLERSKRAAVSNEDMINSLALAELVSYIEDARTESSIAPVFQLSDLVTLYTSRIKELGLNVEKQVHSTKLKERNLSQHSWSKSSSTRKTGFVSIWIRHRTCVECCMRYGLR